MNDLVVIGTDTDAGKTTFALLWLSAFGAEYAYWKPVETGDSDTEKIRTLLPDAEVHPPGARFLQPVAPPLAARLQGGEVPSAAMLAALRPVPRRPGGHLLIETFGGPLSPLNETELQITLIQLLNRPVVLVVSSRLGAIGRALQCLECLARYGISPQALVLVGEADGYAEHQIGRHKPDLGVYSLALPGTWDTHSLRLLAEKHTLALAGVRRCLDGPPPPQQECGSFDIVEEDRQTVWHPYTSLRDPDAPLVCVAAREEFLWLDDGRRVIDGISSWWTILFGHRHPLLMETLKQASASLDHVHFAGVTHPKAVELARCLLADTYPNGGRVFYSDNGSTAVEVALKMAYQFWCHQGEPQRTLFVAFEGGYHGDTFGAMAASRDPVFFGRFEPLLFRADIVPVSPERLDETLARRRGEVAAVILEPLVQGAGGMRMHSADVLRDLAEAARRHGVLFIADEVMTRGRLGPLWAHKRAGINPDLICTAKTLAGGVLPLAATLAAPHIVAAFDTDDRTRTFFHGHSFTAHPLACAVAVATLDLWARGGEPAAPTMGFFWRRALGPLSDLPQVREVRVNGSIAAVELNVPGGYLANVGRQLRQRCLERGVLLRPLGNVLYAMPPLWTSPASLEQIADAMRYAVTSLS